LNVSVVLERSWLPEGLVDSERPAWLIRTAREAVRQGLEPWIPPVPTGETVTIRVYLSADARAELNSCLDTGPSGPCLAGLVRASVRASDQSSDQSSERVEGLSPNGQTASTGWSSEGLREGQRFYRQAVLAPVQQGAVALIEMGTGSGKTLAAQIAAVDETRRTGRPAVVTVPTLLGLSQAVRDWAERLRPEWFGLQDRTELPAMAFLFGRNSFISPSRLSAWLEIEEESLRERDQEPDQPLTGKRAPPLTPAEIEQVRQWCRAGAKSTTPRTKPLHDHVPGLSWLADDLEALASGIPLDRLRIQPEDRIAEGDPAYEVYARLRQQAHSAGVILCTHAMLGLDSIRKSRSETSLSRREKALEHEIGLLIQRLGDRPKNKAVIEEMIERRSAQLQNIQKRIEQLNLQKNSHCSEFDQEMGLEPDLEPVQEGGAKLQAQGILPDDLSLLIVDEAHQFEASIAALRSSELNPRLSAKVISDFLDQHADEAKKLRIKGNLEDLASSLSGLRYTLEGRYQIHKKDRLTVMGALAEVGSSVRETERLIRDWAAQLRGSGVLEGILKKTQGKSTSIRSEASVLSQVLLQILSPTTRASLQIAWSPTKKYPSLIVGPSSVRSLLERIWDNFPAVILQSGTLFIPDSLGRPQINYLREVLAIPRMREQILDGHHPLWLKNFETEISVSPRLRPPRVEELSDLGATLEMSPETQDWVDAVAEKIIQVESASKGGVLALTSSYDRADWIRSALMGAHPDWAERLVVQGRARGARGAVRQYEAIYRAGLKPIWIGTGGAWTGLDLVDRQAEQPEDDLLLTDLVIINVPFGTSRTSTHEARARTRWHVERDRAVLEFRQGMGRLMRREGVRHRKLWLLDPRIQTGGARYAPFRHLIAPTVWHLDA